MVTDQGRVQLDGAASMDRRELIASILRVDCGFPVDFTPEYLSTLSDTKLRHVYIALCRSAGKGSA